jgi:hypothetical protein
MNRVVALIDGFNLYHSVRSATQPGDGMRWLDLAYLCRTTVTSMLPPPTDLVAIHYFSALAAHREERKPGTLQRHNKDLVAVANATLKLGDHHYRTHQLPNPVISGLRTIAKPAHW